MSKELKEDNFEEDIPIKCSECGRFVKCSTYTGEGDEEMISCKCSCGNEWSEGY